MKKLALALVWGLFLVFGLRAQALDPSNSTATVSIYATVCPSPEAGNEVWVPFTSHVKGFLAGTNSEFSGITPFGFHSITAAFWRYICVSGSEFPLWLGEPTPGVQRGNGVLCPFKVVFYKPTVVSDIKITYYTWDSEGKRSETIGLRSPQFVEDFFVGISPAGETLTSGYLTNTSVEEIHSIGIPFAYRVDNQAGIEALLACPNFQQIAGLSCVVEVFQGETLLARGQVDLPFNPEPSRLLISGSSIRVDGMTNQQYRIQQSSTLESGWKTIGLPVFSGTDVVLETTGMFRAFQGELPNGTLNARLPLKPF